jgi:hypothetical protein
VSKQVRWTKAIDCSATSCVEVAAMDGMVGIRDSKSVDSPVLLYTPREWRTFVTGVKRGDFDSLLGGRLPARVPQRQRSNR